MKFRRERKEPQQEASQEGQQVLVTPPQTELDSSVRNILSHMVKHLGAITFTLAPIEELQTGFVCWDVAQKPDMTYEITVWWMNVDPEGSEAGNEQESLQAH